MNSKKPAEMSNEDLIKSEKTLRSLIIIMSTMCVLLLAAGTYLVIKKQHFNALIALPIGLFTVALVNSNSLKEIRKEIQLRNL